MQHNERIENSSIIEHLERAVEARKARLRDGLATELPKSNDPSATIMMPTRPTSSNSPRIQEQALVQMQAMLSQVERGAHGEGPLQESPEIAELRRTVHQRCAELRDGLTRLADDVTRLADAATRRNGHTNGYQNGHSNGSTNGHAPAPPAANGTNEAASPKPTVESKFEATGWPLRVVLEAVPDFEAATAVQQALSDMPQATSAAVIEFEDASASLDVDLDVAVSLREIMDQLREHTGRHYLVEQARPDEHRLRVRFIEHEEDKVAAGLRPDLWQKA